MPTDPATAQGRRVLGAIRELVATAPPGSGVSLRRIAESAQVAHSTARAWRDRLVDDGLIEVLPRGRQEAPEVRVLGDAP